MYSTHIDAALNKGNEMAQPTKALRNHSNFDADDFAYLRGKGWTNAEILARWNQEAANGTSACRWATSAAKSKLAAVTRKGN